MKALIKLVLPAPWSPRNTTLRFVATGAVDGAVDGIVSCCCSCCCEEDGDDEDDAGGAAGAAEGGEEDEEDEPCPLEDRAFCPRPKESIWPLLSLPECGAAPR